MRTPWSSLPLFAMSFLLACPDEGSSDTSTGPTTTQTTDTSGDGDGEPGDGDGDGEPGDGDGEPGDGDGEPGDGDSFCLHQCMSDADCFVQGMDLEYTCVDNTCTSGTPGCTTNEECVALYSGWTVPCTSGGGECDGTLQVCIDAGGGNGLCATPPSDIIPCDLINQEEIEAVDIDGNPVTVCAQPDAVCNDESYCFVPCASDDDCLSDAYPICDVGSGVCQCGSDTDCATIGTPNSSVCNAGVCGCGEDQHCIDGNVGDVCTPEGFCGCSGDMACEGVTNPYDGGTISCEQL